MATSSAKNSFAQQLRMQNDGLHAITKLKTNGSGSPIAAIATVIESLFERTAKLAKSPQGPDPESIQRLEEDYRERVRNLRRFLQELNNNDLELPEDEIESLRQMAEILAYKLKELSTYFTLLRQAPDVVVTLLEFRQSTLFNHNEQLHMKSVNEIVNRIIQPQVRNQLLQQLKQQAWYGYAFSPTQISQTVDLLNTYFSTRSTINYADLLSYLHKHGAVFFPLDKATIAKISNTFEMVNYEARLNETRDKLKSVTQDIIRVNNIVVQIQQQVEPLELRRLDTIPAILEDYDLHLRPRVVKVRELNEQSAQLQLLEQQLLSIRQILLKEMRGAELREVLLAQGVTESALADILKQREALIASYDKFEAAIPRLKEQIAKAHRELSTIPLPDSSSRAPDEDSYRSSLAVEDGPKAFFDGPGFAAQPDIDDSARQTAGSPSWSKVLTKYVLTR